jgi:hypothetical protein
MVSKRGAKIKGITPMQHMQIAAKYPEQGC